MTEKVAMFVLNSCEYDARVIKEAKSLTDLGFVVRVFALAGPSCSEGLFIRSEYEIQRIKVFPFLSKVNFKLFDFFYKLTKAYFFCRIASKEAVKWGAEIVHAHDLSTMIAAKKVKDRLGAKVIYDSHELWTQRNKAGKRYGIQYLLDCYMERKLIYKADVIIVVCESIKKWLMKNYIGIVEPVILRNIPYFNVESENINSAYCFKKKLKIAQENKSIVYTGKLTHGRGILIALRLLQKRTNYHFVILGYGTDDYVKKLNKAIALYGVNNRVTLVPPIPHECISNFISGADFSWIYIEPICLSYEYALPNKLFEAIQAKVPVLGSNLIEIRKIVEQYNIGICLDVEGDIEKALSRVTDSQIRRWRANCALLAKELCWQNEVKILEQSYSQFYEH